METLFSSYDRISELDESEDMGTGLGLDISHRFAELLGGELTCESEVGKGSTFVFTLRQRIIDHTPIGDFVGLNEVASADNYIPLFKAPDADVLLVSNDAMTVKVIKGLLRATEVFVTTASEIDECMDIIRNTKINIVLFDMALGSSEGDDTEKLRLNDSELPIYAITSETSVAEEKYRKSP